MGSRLVAEVSVKFADVGYDAFRVLVHMANHSLDTENGNQKARRYFGGQEVLARAMRPELPSEEDPSDEAKTAWKNALRDLRRAMEILVVCGAVTRTVKRPKPGERQEWLLTLRRKAAPVTPSMARRKARDAERRRRKMEGVTPPAVEGTTPPAFGGGDTPAVEGTSPPPQEPRRNHGRTNNRNQIDPVSAQPQEGSELGAATDKSHGQMDPETARRYNKAAAALMDLADFGLGVRAQIRDQLGENAPEHEVVIRAAERFTGRRTG